MELKDRLITYHNAGRFCLRNLKNSLNDSMCAMQMMKDSQGIAEVLDDSDHAADMRFVYNEFIEFMGKAAKSFLREDASTDSFAIQKMNSARVVISSSSKAMISQRIGVLEGAAEAIREALERFRWALEDDDLVKAANIAYELKFSTEKAA